MMIFSFNIRDRKTPKKKVWENDKTIITGMMWWTLQLKVFYCDALARRFHVSQQAVLSGQRIWKFKCWWDNEVMNVDLNEMVYFSCAQKQTYFCCTLESLECWPWLNVVLVKTYFCCASESLDVNHDWLSTYFCWASSLLTPSTAFQASHLAPPLDKGYLDDAPDYRDVYEVSEVGEFLAPMWWLRMTTHFRSSIPGFSMFTSPTVAWKYS